MRPGLWLRLRGCRPLKQGRSFDHQRSASARYTSKWLLDAVGIVHGGKNGP